MNRDWSNRRYMILMTCVVVWGLCCLCVGSLSAGPVISEFMASNHTTLEDEDGNYPDWIEIHNPGESAVDLAGWHLTDDETELNKWTFPSVTLPPGGYILVFASDKNRSVAGEELHTNFKLSAAGEFLALVQPDGVTSASAFHPYPPQQSDVSYGLPQGGEIIEGVIAPGTELVFHVPSAPVEGWELSGFDDSGWISGRSGLGYERDASGSYDPWISTDVEDFVFGVNSSVYLRIPFQVSDLSQLTSLSFAAKYDDGFLAYLNGELITKVNTPTPALWSSAATASQEADLLNDETWNADALIPHLVEGENILAIHWLNRTKTSSDFLMIPRLDVGRLDTAAPGEYDYFTEATPGWVNNTGRGEPSCAVVISEPSGVKTSALRVTVTAEDVNADIRYTLDGSEPTEASALYSGPMILDDPSRLRARAFQAGKVGGVVAVADYSFLESEMLNYLSDVPVVVMDNFNAGAYPNKGRTNDGRDVQQVPRQANVMSIFEPAGDSQPFAQVPTLESRSGCRVRGSSSANFTRKPLSVEFWGERDEDEALSPFGMKEEADWVLYAPNPTYDKSLLHNPVSFEFAKMIGALAPEWRVVVVFQNTDGGKVKREDLAGVYVWMEKVERGRMGLDFKKMDDTGTQGGWMINVDRMAAIPEDMPADTIQPNFHAAGPDGILSIPDDQQNSGGSQSVDDISTYYHSYLNFASPNGYGILPAQRQAVQSSVRAMDAAVWAPDFDDPLSGYAVHLDLESWARTYAVHNFSKNTDAIVLSTYVYQASASEKIKMGPVWDFDRAYTQNGSATSSPLHVADRDWYKGLFKDSYFVQTHQDLWQKTRQESATDTALEALIDTAAAGLREDQIVASGLSYSAWQSQVASMRTWVVDRARYLDRQYEPLPEVLPLTEQFAGSVSVTMSGASSGSIYYTVDGSDPRLRDGAVSGAAHLYDGVFELTERTRLLVRVKNGDAWSGLIERNYHQLSDLPRLVVSEISYHPADPSEAEILAGFDDSDDFEFLEILNVGDQSADLMPLVLDGGIGFEFSGSAVTILAPGERLVVVRNEAAFRYRYGQGVVVAGAYRGALNNAGDLIVLRDALLDIDIQHFTYDDDAPWPLQADGSGHSLVLMRPDREPDHSLAKNWRCSRVHDGEPGAEDARAAFVGDPHADHDGDGLSALVEHFLGSSDLDPGEGRGQYRVEFETSAADGLRYPEFHLTYQVGADDVQAGVFWSQDLKTWLGDEGAVALKSHVFHGDGSATLIWQSSHDDETSAQFFRWVVDQQ